MGAGLRRLSVTPIFLPAPVDSASAARRVAARAAIAGGTVLFITEEGADVGMCSQAPGATLAQGD